MKIKRGSRSRLTKPAWRGLKRRANANKRKSRRKNKGELRPLVEKTRRRVMETSRRADSRSTIRERFLVKRRAAK